jgi:hypothetical protein
MYNLYSKKSALIIISAIYFIGMFCLLLKFGININGEASKYIEDANAIINSNSLRQPIFSCFYILYSLIVAFFIKFSISYIWIGIFQICLSFFAAILLSKLIVKKTDNKFIGLLCFIIYLACYPIQKWLFFVYSEGIHTSLVTIGLCLFIKMFEEKGLRNHLLFVLVSIFIITSRPVGIIFFISSWVVYIHYLYSLENKKKAYLFSLVSLILFLVLLNSPFRYFINPDSIKRMEIICQVPEANKEIVYHEYNKEGLISAFKTIINETGIFVFIKNGFLKLAYTFTMWRPFFSLKNNLFQLIFTLLYPFALYGIFSKQNKKLKIIKLFSVSYISITSFGIFITCADWSNRFIAPVFPFIIILACLGLLHFYAFIKKFIQSF